MAGMSEYCAEIVKRHMSDPSQSPAEEQEALAQTQAFLDQVRMDPQALVLWNALSDILFWIKDRNGRFVWINDYLASQTQLPKSEVIGKTDVDCFPNELASIYMHDDAEILEKGTSIINKPELVMTPEGGVEWRQTTKSPIHSKAGSIVGTTGVSRKLAEGIPLPPEYATLAKMIGYITDNLSKRILIRDLARTTHLSISTLERYIHSHLRISPITLLRKIRMNRACQLLSNSTLNISEIATECGYESLSSFSRAFRRQHGMTPGDYRARQISGLQPELEGLASSHVNA
jgi:AraC-like DNA-binding protein